MLFLLSVPLGAGLGVVYDCFRVLRAVFPPAAKPRAVFAEDVLFCLIYGFSVFCYCAVLARGQVRFFIVFGSLLGFALYLLTIGSVVIGIIRGIAEAVRKLLRKVYSYAIEPVVNLLRIFCQKISRFFVGNHKNAPKSKGSVKKLLKNIAAMVYNKKAVLYIPLSKRKKNRDTAGSAEPNKGNAIETSEGGSLPQNGKRIEI